MLFLLLIVFSQVELSLKLRCFHVGWGMPMPFKQGQSGNPAGKKPGTRNRGSEIAEELLRASAPHIWRGVVERAVADDPAMIKLCLERILPPRRGRCVDLARFLSDTDWDYSEAQLAVANEMLSGQISPDEALALSEILGGVDGARDDVLQKRLADLEAQSSQTPELTKMIRALQRVDAG